MSIPAEILQNAKRIVIKLGTQVVVESEGTLAGALAWERLTTLARECAELVRAGKEVILVSSGAVGLGRQKLKLSGQLTLTEKQACAAVGQNLLMDAWQGLFGRYELLTAQVLLTAMDFADRRHYLNLRQTLETLLKLGVIPVINENDSVSTMELQDEGYKNANAPAARTSGSAIAPAARASAKGFGDNDKLSALVASKLEAELLVILTNVDGIYTDNPAINPEARRLTVIESFNDLHDIQTAGRSTMGRGGMGTKLEAARLAAISGVHTWITSGLREHPLANLLKTNDEHTGTLVLPQAAISGKKRWIGASGYRGVVIVNEGARTALVEKRASLLPIGIIGVEGEFAAQQVVSIQDERRMEIGRGLCHFSSEEVQRIQGLKSEKIAEVLNGKSGDRAEVIHRDNLVIFQEQGME